MQTFQFKCVSVLVKLELYMYKLERLINRITPKNIKYILSMYEYEFTTNKYGITIGSSPNPSLYIKLTRSFIQRINFKNIFRFKYLLERRIFKYSFLRMCNWTTPDGNMH